MNTLKLSFWLTMASIILISLSCNQHSDNNADQTSVNQDSLKLIEQQNTQFEQHKKTGDSLMNAEAFELAAEHYHQALELTDDAQEIAMLENKLSECEAAIEYQNSPIGKTEKLLLGKRVFGIQFIWDGYGSALIAKENDILTIDGKQFSKDKTEYCKLKGSITIIDERKLRIDGDIEIYTHDCCGLIKKSGSFHFLKSGNRKYWRWQEFGQYCSIYTCAYYLDIFE